MAAAAATFGVGAGKAYWPFDYLSACLNSGLLHSSVRVYLHQSSLVISGTAVAAESRSVDSAAAAVVAAAAAEPGVMVMVVYQAVVALLVLKHQATVLET